MRFWAIRPAGRSSARILSRAVRAPIVVVRVEIAETATIAEIVAVLVPVDSEIVVLVRVGLAIAVVIAGGR